jgi:hypothetical protein
VLDPAVNMADCFAATFSHEGEPGYCFGYDDLKNLRWKAIPRDLEELLQKLRKSVGAKIYSLSIGLNSRYWISYTDGTKADHGVYYGRELF